MKNLFNLSKDGAVKFTGNEFDCYLKLQQMQGQSADWAMKYEGWKIEPTADTKILVKKVYPIEGRKDFFKFVVMDSGLIARGYSGNSNDAEMYFDNKEDAQRVADARRQVRRKRLAISIKLALFFVLFCLGAQCSAQTTVKMDSTGIYHSFKQAKDTTAYHNTGKFYEDAKGNLRPIYLTDNGAHFIWRKSEKSGLLYKQYLKID